MKRILNDVKYFEGAEPKDMIGSLWMDTEEEVYVLAQIETVNYRMIGLTTGNRFKDLAGNVTMDYLTEGLTPLHGKYKLKKKKREGGI